MSMQLFQLRQRRQELLSKMDTLLKAYESSKTPMMESDKARLTHDQRELESVTAQIEGIEKKNTVLTTPMAAFLGGNQPEPRTEFRRGPRKNMSLAAVGEFFAYIQSNGKKVGEELSAWLDPMGGGFPLPNLSAALYEGTGGSGGYAVPIVVDDQIIPLAPQEMSVRKLALVIPTTSDIKFPQKASFGTATAKAETSAFTESDTTLSQVTLSAFMAGIQETVSWELAQDVPAFQAFTVDDMVLAQQMYEENLYINGSGSGQPQGLIGNVGAGVTEEPDSNGNVVSIAGTLDLIGTLNAVYHPNASWLMSRATSIVIRKAQTESNLFFPAFTRGADGVDRLHGYPVEYATAMPTAARGACPVLFGDFKRGYFIGDRGGSGINVKVLDQVQAQNGLIVLLAYRRTDGRVVRSEAIQSYNVAAS